MERPILQRVLYAVLLAAIAVLSLVSCATTSEKSIMIERAREFAKKQRTDVDHYSATFADRGDHYYVHFIRRGWPRKAGDHFGVSIDKQTDEYSLHYGL